MLLGGTYTFPEGDSDDDSEDEKNDSEDKKVESLGQSDKDTQTPPDIEYALLPGRTYSLPEWDSDDDSEDEKNDSKMPGSWDSQNDNSGSDKAGGGVIGLSALIGGVTWWSTGR